MEIKKKTKNFKASITLVKSPLITEKSISLLKNQYYTFLVDRHLSKSEIKVIFENFFNTKIHKINSCILPVKNKRVGKHIGKRSQYKKIFIQFKIKNYLIDLFNF